MSDLVGGAPCSVGILSMDFFLSSLAVQRNVWQLGCLSDG